MKLKQIRMKNFRGFKEESFIFPTDNVTLIGGNGSGKSTVMNAFFWCLFGKDAEDRKDFNIQRIEGATGKPVPEAETTVSVTLETTEDGDTEVLTRTYRDVWGKVRGSEERVLKGHETVTEWNGVPLNVGDYQKKVDALMPAETFKMLSNPEYFLTLKWDVMRKVLFEITGAAAEEEGDDYDAFPDLKDALRGKTIEELKKELGAKKRKSKDELDTIRPRVDQTEKLKPEARDWDGIEAALTGQTTELKEIEEALRDKAKAVEKAGEERLKLSRQIADHKDALEAIRQDARREAREAAEAKEKEADKLDREVSGVRSALRQHTRDEEDLEAELKQTHRRLDETEEKLAELRARFATIRDEEWNGDTHCNYCHQPLPENMIEDAKGEWNATKADRLNKINEEGKRLSEDKKRIGEEMERTASRLKDVRDKKQEEEKKIAPLQLKAGILRKDASEILGANPEPSEQTEEEKNILKEIDDLTKKLKDLTAGKEDDGTAELKERKAKVEALIYEAKTALRDRDTINRYDAEIKALNARGDALVQALADVEKIEAQIKAYTKAKVEKVEETINGKFTGLAFRLYDETLQGDFVETCIPLVKGVPYGTANTAGKLNAGLQTIKVLSTHYGVKAPVFIDNRERVLNLIPMDGIQIINLKVADAPLQIIL